MSNDHWEISNLISRYAELLNLGRIQGLGAPVASIGGAGTFDGIFVTGILAVLLAGLPLRRAGGPAPGQTAG